MGETSKYANPEHVDAMRRDLRVFCPELADRHILAYDRLLGFLRRTDWCCEAHCLAAKAATLSCTTRASQCFHEWKLNLVSRRILLKEVFSVVRYIEELNDIVQGRFDDSHVPNTTFVSRTYMSA